MRTVAVVAVWLAGSAGCGRLGFDEAGEQVTPSDAYSAAVLDDVPLAYWRLGESNGTEARDEIGAYSGTYRGTCQLGVTGIVPGGDAAARFDGTSCRVEIGDALPFAGNAPFTIELWANPDAVDGSVRWLVSRDTASGLHTGYHVAFQDIELWFERLVDDAGVTYLGTRTAPVTGQFQFFVLTFDGTTQRLYVDATEVNAKDFTVSAPLAAGTLVLGDSARGNAKKFSGVLDEVAFYGHSLAAARVAAHFAAR